MTHIKMIENLGFYYFFPRSMKRKIFFIYFTLKLNQTTFQIVYRRRIVDWFLRFVNLKSGPKRIQTNCKVNDTWRRIFSEFSWICSLSNGGCDWIFVVELLIDIERLLTSNRLLWHWVAKPEMLISCMTKKYFKRLLLRDYAYYIKWSWICC